MDKRLVPLRSFLKAFLFVPDMTKEQIISAIQKEYAKPNPRTWGISIYYYPKKGTFLYDDYPIDFHVILPMITEGVIYYNKCEYHQGQLMPKYLLAKSLR